MMTLLVISSTTMVSRLMFNDWKKEAVMPACGEREVSGGVVCEAWQSLCTFVQPHNSPVHKFDLLSHENHGEIMLFPS